jgi:hypothetical protein
MNSPLFLAAALTVVFLTPAPAVQVLTTTGNTTAPGDDPGFANIGQLNGASAIYLGNRWVLTASHVGSGTVVLGGNAYAPTGPVTQLTNPDASFTDLILFQINTDPGLPALAISPAAPTIGNDLVMIGNGANRNAFRSYYTVTVNPGPANDTWTVAGGPGSGVIELFMDAGGQAVRWGTNNVEFVNIDGNSGFGVVKSFATRLDDDPTGRPFEAQGVTGDSGSGVFRKNGAAWELLGMTHAVGNINNYDNIPGFPSTSIIGESTTFIADLSFYRSQILTVIPEPGSGALAGLTLLGLLRRRRV